VEAIVESASQKKERDPWGAICFDVAKNVARRGEFPHRSRREIAVVTTMTCKLKPHQTYDQIRQHGE